ncbi:hypothetical protein [Halogeometricum borinquense]|uniref:hypothetical protein n=1 Tax=Halogeometricum borinquense TaxID=60847 RepID=UPI001F5DBEAD|nr:hypothetical protein [Halogeometricum borinquense]
MDRFVLAFTLLIGILLVASPLYILPHATMSSYRYTIQSVDEDVETSPVVYSTLPQSAQNTFDSARSTDGVVVKQTTDPAFEPGRSVVTDGDEQYVVRTVREPPSTVLRWLRQALVTFGVVLCCSVGVTLRDGTDRRIGPLSDSRLLVSVPSSPPSPASERVRERFSSSLLSSLSLPRSGGPSLQQRVVSSPNQSSVSEEEHGKEDDRLLERYSSRRCGGIDHRRLSSKMPAVSGVGR